jgi:hypothetical protein
MNKAMKELDPCRHLLQLSTTTQLDLQKQIVEYESRLFSCKSILVEKEIVLSSLKHDFLHMDKVVESSKECLLLAL